MKEYQATDTMRNKAIYKMRKQKKTFAEIGQKYGLTRERIRQICKVLDKNRKG
jgi:DNA-directed RNA polymerase sigma subunit (sigma70/sigma32)